MDSACHFNWFAFSGELENMAILGMEFHEPIFLPLLKSVQVMLKISGIRLSLYNPV